jgi:UrcA family protein
MRRNVPIAFATTVLLWSGSALADSMTITRDVYGQTRTVAVQVGDLDLTRSAGAEELLSRLRFAAVRACDAELTDRDLKMYEFRRQCLRDTMNRAVAAIGSPAVKQLYLSER